MPINGSQGVISVILPDCDFGLHGDHVSNTAIKTLPLQNLSSTQFAKRFDGFSIGSNDLTQLVLGADRDSAELAPLFDERNEAIKKMIQGLINSAHKAKCKVGICGQAPSDYPDFAAFLVKAGIDSISLNPDSIIEVKQRIALIKKKKGQ